MNNTTTTRRRTFSNSNANMIDPPPVPNSNSLQNMSLFSPSDMSLLKALDSDDDEGESNQAMATEDFYIRPSQLPLNLPDFEVPNTPTLNSFTPNSSFFMPEIETLTAVSSAAFPPPPNSLLTAASMANQYAFPTTTAEYMSQNTFFPPKAISTMTSTSGMVRDDLKMSLARGSPLPPPSSVPVVNPNPASPPPIGVVTSSLPGVTIPYKSSNNRRDVLPLVSSFDAIEENDNPPANTSGEKKDKKALASEAYERKKERAKQGRIKLNESIEQLSLSISNTHATSVGHLKASEQLSHALSDLTLASLASPVMGQANRIMEVSSRAKKWDRPTFIGIAAELISSLNDQCDNLYHEYYNLKHHQKYLQSNKAPPTTPPPATSNFNSSSNSNANSNSLKRQRTELEASPNSKPPTPSGSFTLIMSSVAAFQHVAYFLTPVCLAKMRTLGRTFRYAAPLLSDSTYRQLSISRFGSKIKTSSIARLSTPWVDKYRLLVSRNTPPTSLVFPQQIGSSISPPSPMRMPSAWVSLVERSNGETNRAVLQENKKYKALPIVLLRVLIQNTTAQVVTLNDQLVSVDSNCASIPSFVEVRSDPRLTKVYKDLSGKLFKTMGHENSVTLRMFESVIMEVNVHCQHCPTETKFLHYAKRMSLTVGVDGIPTALDITFLPTKLRKKSR